MHFDHWYKYKGLTDTENETYFIMETSFGETIDFLFAHCDQTKIQIDLPTIGNVINTFYFSHVSDTDLRNFVVQIIERINDDT